MHQLASSRSEAKGVEFGQRPSTSNDVQGTQQSTYQQMNMGGDTNSASDRALSASDQYRPLASNSSRHQLSCKSGSNM